jgi:hypothetical protein
MCMGFGDADLNIGDVREEVCLRGARPEAGRPRCSLRAGAGGARGGARLSGPPPRSAGGPEREAGGPNYYQFLYCRVDGQFVRASEPV